jgi:hypothetical protein
MYVYTTVFTIDDVMNTCMNVNNMSKYAVKVSALCINFSVHEVPFKWTFLSVTSVQCYGSGSGAFLTPGYRLGTVKTQYPDHISKSFETIFWVKNT